MDEERPISVSAVLGGAALTGWLVACDLWVKILARMGTCASSTEISQALMSVWTVPEGCSAVEVVPGATLDPAVRSASVLPVPLPEGAGQVWGLALFGLATIVTILVLRWEWRTRGDALALGTLWAGVLVHGSPRLLHEGTTFTELNLWGFATGLGDLAIAWSVLWLLWRLVAELRA